MTIAAVRADDRHPRPLRSPSTAPTRSRALRDEFALPEGVIYLDGNSLGALPRRTAARLAEVAAREWGEGLIRSWNNAGWIDLSRRIGDKIAALVGAGAARSASATRPRSTASRR